MNYRTRIVTTITLLALVVVSSEHSAAGNQKPRKLTFEFLMCSVGPLGSHQIYKVSDGTTVSVESEMYVTLEEAKKRFANELRLARRIYERTDLSDEAGQKVGERLVFVTGSARHQRTVRVTLNETFFHKIEAASLRHVNAFRSWESAT